MIARIIEFSIRNRFIVLLGTAAVALWGLYCLFRTPIDAIPDLSENQVIVWTDWPGRSPREVEDQITYPLSVNLQGLAGVKVIRATSEFGFSMINIIFDEHIGFYFSRERVLERLSIAASFLPEGVVPYMAPDATALGQIFWYTVEGEGKSLDELRSIQDWFVRYQLNSVPGVAEVASVGGFVREYQVDVDPEKLRAFGVTLGEVFSAIQGANSSVGGQVVHKENAEYLVRGYGWIRGLEDIENVVIAERSGVPITVGRLGTVQLGPSFRRGALEKGGGEAAGGVVLMRYGENPLAVTERIQAKIRELERGLPEGVRIVPFYDRTGLIHASIDTLSDTLIEEIIIASIVVFLVLFHLRSAVVICCTLPLAVLISFIFMYYLDVPSNIMSLSGIAISIGVLIDAGIVMTENAYNRLHERFGGEKVTGDTRPIVEEACKLVGGPLFFSIAITLLSFAPIFVLGGMEGRMFNPLAWTKSFALVGVAVLAITLVPALIPLFIRGRLRSQEEVWLVRSFVHIYRPMLDFFLRHPDAIVLITGLFLLIGLPIFPQKVPWLFFVLGVPFIVAFSVMLIARHKVICFATLFFIAIGGFMIFDPLGEEFMPPLDEQALMDMPVTAPSVNITQAVGDVQKRDATLRGFPEVHQVVGKVGRAETPTDPAPIDMVETVVSLRPRSWWPKRKIRFDDALQEAELTARELEGMGVLKELPGDELIDFASTVAGEALERFDRTMRELSVERLREFVPEKGRALVRLLKDELLAFLAGKRALKQSPPEGAWTALEDDLTAAYASRLDEWVLQADVVEAAGRIVRFLEGEGAVQPGSDHLAEPPGALAGIVEPLRLIAGRERPDLFKRLRTRLEAEHARLMEERAKHLSWEIADRAPGMLIRYLLDGWVSWAGPQDRLLREPGGEELKSLRERLEGPFGRGLLLWRKQKDDVRNEMDAELQVPGWSNIWTQPIINRVDMLSTGVRSPIGIKVYGNDLETIQRVSDEVAGVIRGVRGAANVVPDQVVGENYLEVAIDREKAARYGVMVEDIQAAVETAIGGKEITRTVEGRQRFPVRVRYPRDWRAGEDALRGILVAARSSGAGGDQRGPGAMDAGGAREEGLDGAAAGIAAAPGAQPMDSTIRLRQVPISLVADIRIVPGPSMIKSENGLLRSYVQASVRDRDMVGFVEEAKRAVEAQVEFPPGTYTEWTGQFEHQVRAQKTLTIVLPLVILIIFVVLYLTYRDLPDTLMMFLSVPGAVAGGALFQYIFGYDFSVAVWVGYIACFGLATETGIVMLVYLREALARRGGLEAIRSEAEIRDAVMEGAVHRLRPKLLTEGTTILALIPMLWATGVGSEFMRPMAAPILGGILVADEVIDIFIPVLFFRDRRRRWRKLHPEV